MLATPCDFVEQVRGCSGAPIRAPSGFKHTARFAIGLAYPATFVIVKRYKKIKWIDSSGVGKPRFRIGTSDLAMRFCA